MTAELYTLDDILPDPPRTPDMRRHIQLCHVYTALTAHFCKQPDVLLAGGGYLRNNADDQDELLAPDWIVTFGVDPDGIIARNGYVIGEVGKPPDFVLDIAVQYPEPHDYDYDTRCDGYAKYGVREFWYLDHHAWYSSQPHDVILTGDKLVNGEYIPISTERSTDGVIWGHSEVLGLDVCWDSGRLQFYDPSAGSYLPNAEELKSELDTERARRLEAEATIQQLCEQLRETDLEE